MNEIFNNTEEVDEDELTDNDNNNLNDEEIDEDD